ncbi:transposase protein [Holotrichia oblita]|uniref:Transposase protein n=1 Tax=Holotrichia oblita TaxID=644536 RepID=A0ACB9THD7_HOLOL|nr:transposase protein [Holotrichia oblita]
MYNTQVNMMSAQMLNSAGSVAGTVADLAPSVKDGMKCLKRKLLKWPERPRQRRQILCLFAVKLKEIKVVGIKFLILTIDIDDDDEGGDEEIEIPLEQQSVPAKVFGGLKKTNDDEEDDGE